MGKANKTYYKKIMAFILVLCMVFTSKSFDGLKLVYAENMSEVENNEEMSSAPLDIENVEEENTDLLMENSMQDEEADKLESEEIDKDIDIDNDTDNNIEETEKELIENVDESVFNEDNDNENTDAENIYEGTSEEAETNSTITNDEKDSTDNNRNDVRNDESETSETNNSDETVSDEEITEEKNIVDETKDTDENNVGDEKNIEEETIAIDSIIEEDIISAFDENNDEIATSSDIELYENIATVSEVSEVSEEMFTTSNEIIDNYENLSAFEQILYNESESCELDGDTIVLKNNVKLEKAIHLKNNNLDLAGFNIVGPANDSAVYIEGNFTLTNSAENIGAIIGMSNNFATVVINEAKVDLQSGKIYGANGSDILNEEKITSNKGGRGIEIINSDVVINGAEVYGGEGEEVSGIKGGDGGDAVVVKEVNVTNKITINSGAIVGGKGANGLGDKKPKVGPALKVLDKNYVSDYFGNGFPGNIGGGNGGVGLNVLTKNLKSENLTYEDWTLNEGSCGYSEDVEVNDAKVKEINASMEDNNRLLFKSTADNLFGDNAQNATFSLHNVDGKNYLTSLKDQGGTELCTVFSTTAYAETSLLKDYPEYVKNILGKDVDTTYDLSTWDTNENELNLSEMQLGMAWRVQPDDIFGNAGSSKRDSSSNWARYGFSVRDIVTGVSTWRSLVEEDEVLKWDNNTGSSLVNRSINRNTLNNYIDKVVVTADTACAYSAGDFYNGTTFDRDGFVAAAKNAIVNNNGVIMLVYTCGSNTISGGYGSYSLDGVDYGNVGITSTPDAYNGNLGGHALYCVGWDDNVTFTVHHNRGGAGADYEASYTGAFIIKNSWEEFSFIPYDNNFIVYKNGAANFESFISMDFVPSYSVDENIYYYDTGFGAQYYETENTLESFYSASQNRYINVHPADAKKIAYGIGIDYHAAAVTFKIRNDKEVIRKFNVYLDDAENLRVSLYKVDSLTDGDTIYNNLNNDDNRLTDRIVFNGHSGINIVELPTPLDVDKNDMVAIKIESATDNSSFGNLYVDTNYTGNDGITYETVDAGRSFLLNCSAHVTKLASPSTISGGVASNYVVYEEGTVEFNANFNQAIANAYINTYNNHASYKKLVVPGNLRIKLITNNYVKISANGHGNYDGNETTYYYPELRASMSDLPEPENVPSNKKFVKYNTESDGSGVDYNKSSIYHIKSGDELMLYAKYDDIYTLSFSANGGKGTMESLKGEYGEIVTLITVPRCKFTRVGYEFDSWVDENGNKVPVGQEITLSADKELIATWKEKKYAISYVLNDGAFNEGYIAPDSRLFTKDIVLPTSENITRSGYTFDGWYDNKDFSGSVYVKTKAANKETIYTFYAKWSKKSSKPVTPSGGSPGGGGGGGGGGAAIPMTNTQVTKDTRLTTPMNQVSMSYASANSAWAADPNGNWHLTMINAAGEEVPAKNTFVCLQSDVVNALGQTTTVLDFYYFDNDGLMYTGWLRDANNVTYYFDKTAGANQGKLARGWMKVDESYYYFDGNGVMLSNTTTPDGYVVDANGKWLAG